MPFRLPKLKANKVFMCNLKLELTPDVLFKPRFASEGDLEERIKETQGFCFYVEYLQGHGVEKPSLMLMKTYKLTSKTIGEVDGVPEDLLWGAVREEGVKDIMGMYPLSRPLREWVKKELGL
jgi:hypothetical protein